MARLHPAGSVDAHVGTLLLVVVWLLELVLVVVMVVVLLVVVWLLALLLVVLLVTVWVVLVGVESLVALLPVLVPPLPWLLPEVLVLAPESAPRSPAASAFDSPASFRVAVTAPSSAAASNVPPGPWSIVGLPEPASVPVPQAAIVTNPNAMKALLTRDQRGLCSARRQESHGRTPPDVAAENIAPKVHLRNAARRTGGRPDNHAAKRHRALRARKRRLSCDMSGVPPRAIALADERVHRLPATSPATSPSPSHAGAPTP
jgi:hypothetical protein